MVFALDRVLVACFVGALSLAGACFKETSSGGSGGTDSGEGSTGDDGDGTAPDDGGDDGDSGSGGGGSSDGTADETGDTGGGTDGTSGETVTATGETGNTGGETGNTGSGMPAFFCEENAPPTEELNPDEKKTIEGTNGTFVDECDANGNLVEYVCDTETECGPPPNPDCDTFQTGEVIPMEFDCDGTCVDGTCVSRCPEFDDMLEYIAVGPTVVFRNLEDSRLYSCTLIFDIGSDSYDCETDPTVGDQTVVHSLGLQTEWCTGGAIGNIGTGNPQQCTYSCSIVS
jgi:hypothetical protein